MATTVAGMMTNGTKDSARPHNNQLRGRNDSNCKGNKEYEGSKGDSGGGYGDNVNERDHAAAMMENGNKDSASPHSTTINLR